jgi:hypothetical protein
MHAAEELLQRFGGQADQTTTGHHQAQSIRNQSLSNFFVACGQVRDAPQHVTKKFGKLFFSIPFYTHIASLPNF